MTRSTQPHMNAAWSESGSGPPLVLLHGFGAHSIYWQPWLPRLRERFTCITVDLPGFGRAPAPPDGDYSPRGLARAVVDLIRQLDLQDCTLAGHSLGGGVALLAALDLLDRADAGEKARVSRIVSVAGAAYRQREPPFVRLARHGVLSRLGFAMLPKRRLVRATMKAIVVQQDAVTDERVEAYAGPMRDPDHRRAFLACARRIVPDDLDTVVARFPELDVPALCLWGRQDPVVPLSVGQRLARELPQARLVVLEDCGHQVVEEHSRTSLDALLSFLDATASDHPSSSVSSDRSGPGSAGSNPTHRNTGSGG